MGWGKFFKGLLVAERRAAAIAALTGVKVGGVPVGQLQQQGEQIGAEVAQVVKESKAAVKQFKKKPASSTGE